MCWGFDEHPCDLWIHWKPAGLVPNLRDVPVIIDASRKAQRPLEDRRYFLNLPLARNQKGDTILVYSMVNCMLVQYIMVFYRIFLYIMLF